MCYFNYLLYGILLLNRYFYIVVRVHDPFSFQEISRRLVISGDRFRVTLESVYQSPILCEISRILLVFYVLY